MGVNEENLIEYRMAELDYAGAQRELYDRLKYQVEFAQAGLKNLTLVNGGAIVALFTVLGHNNIHIHHDSIWWAFVCFSMGVIGALSAYVSAFYSQLHFMNATIHEMWNSQAKMFGKDAIHDVPVEHKKGMWALFAGSALMFVSLLGFILGACFSLSAVI